MIPFANETVTLIHRSETTGTDGRHHASYSSVQLTGCSWHRTIQTQNDSAVHSAGERITVRIPANQTMPTIGDLLIRGSYSGTVTSGADYQGIIESMRSSGGAFLVQSVSDNSSSGSPIPHFKATGWS